MVTSHEYKIMLKADQFQGDRDALLERVERFWDDFTKAITPIVIDVDGELNEVKKERHIQFYDTDEPYRLRINHYVFRERIEIENNQRKQREVTLKFRHRDQDIARDRYMGVAADKEGETKFEEDIKIPFERLYSYSTKQDIGKDKKLNRMDDPVGLYPGLAEKLNQYKSDEAIRPVHGNKAHELVIQGDNKPEFRVDRNPNIDCECALIVWYKAGDQMTNPLLVEFSFKYEERGGYSGTASQRAEDVFEILQGKQMEKWVNLKGITKTAFMYSQKFED